MRSPLTNTSMAIGRKPSSSTSRSNSSAVTIHGPSVVPKSLPLAGSEAHLHLAGLDVARRPVVEDRVAEDVPGGLGRRQVATVGARDAADHGADLELEVEPLGRGRVAARRRSR